jgi:hypothetical protein
MSWFDYLYHECAGFRAEVDGVIGKYGSISGRKPWIWRRR